jgi:hypothetical protein
MGITEKLLYVWGIYLITPISVYLFLALTASMPIHKISIGLGKRVFKYKKVNLHLFPITASLELQPIKVEHLMVSPLERKPLLFRITWLFAGSLALVILGAPYNHSIIISSFISGLYQPFTGMLSPLTTAQEYLSIFWSFADSRNALSIAGLIGIKALALNVIFLTLRALPTPLEKVQDPKPWLQSIQQKILFIIWLFLRALIITWLISVAYFIYGLTG